MRRLERAAAEHDPRVAGVNVIPAFEPLCADPRFAALVRQIGLVP